MHDFERLRLVAEEAKRARDVARREHEPIRRSGEPGDQIAQHMAQAGEVLEGPELERLVQQEGHRCARAAAGALEERDQRVERRPRRADVDVDIRRGERRRVDHRSQQPLRRRRHALDVDVLAAAFAETLAQPAKEERAAHAAAADEHGNPHRIGFERGQHAPFERRTGGGHATGLDRRPLIGSRTPRSAATASASG